MTELRLTLEDREWELESIDHDRQIARAVVFDDTGSFYFVRVIRDDDFGKATLIETAGGGVWPEETPEQAVHREIREELGFQVRVIAKIGIVSDYYNLIHRHNINHYFLCKVVSQGDRALTREEVEDFHLSTLKLTLPEAMEEYRRHTDTKLGRLIANRELPILQRAEELLSPDPSAKGEK